MPAMPRRVAVEVAADAGDGAPARFARLVAERATRAHGRRTLLALLDAAVAELSEHGYHGARMSRIARRAGTAHGTLYVYFADKADLIGALYADAAGDLEPVLSSVPALEASEPGYLALQAWVRSVCEVFLRHGAVLQALTESMDDDSAPEAGKAALRILARTSRRIADRVREADGGAGAGAGDLDAEMAAVVVWALIEGASRSVFRGELIVELDDLAAGVAELVYRSVFGSPAGA
jgi:AcrR family transcriptional regulator